MYDVGIGGSGITTLSDTGGTEYADETEAGGNGTASLCDKLGTEYGSGDDDGAGPNVNGAVTELWPGQ
jgi:hypothetical protein